MFTLETKEDLNALLASCRPRVSQFSQSSQNFVSQENENKSAATPTLESTKYIKMVKNTFHYEVVTLR